jgi:adenine phosphoribosyltransferase
MTTALRARIAAAIRDVPDFPTAGILFKDITPVLSDPALMRDITAALAAPFASAGITHVVGVESRGFLFGMPLALALNCAFAPARKPGKLPWKTEREEYVLEYRRDVLEMHTDALEFSASSASRPRVLVVDDLLATGGTASATARLVERLGGEVVAVAVLVELGFLNGRAAMPGRDVHSLLTY